MSPNQKSKIFLNYKEATLIRFADRQPQQRCVGEHALVFIGWSLDKTLSYGRGWDISASDLERIEESRVRDIPRQSFIWIGMVAWKVNRWCLYEESN